MATNVILDAMISRADFWQNNDHNAVEGSLTATKASSITFENLQASSNFVLSLRKPDFQRETNQWSVSQAVGFIQSFLDGELVPSVILWQSSDGFVFAIDGAHRLSALRAWIEDDYGDGVSSIAFYKGEISDEQKKTAKKLRDRVERVVGSYKSLKDKLAARRSGTEVSFDKITNNRLKNLTSRQLDLQWVDGDAEVAEVSFFKINTQGTALNKTEEELLRNRSRSHAIAARCIVRAGSGHKYWSKFSSDNQKKIENLSQEINTLIFKPELQAPVKSLQLPLGGPSTPLDALSLLLKLLSITDGNHQKKVLLLKDSPVDDDGTETINTLKKCISTLRWITGHDKASLGLHPAIYFYSERGKHTPELFYGTCYLFKRKLDSNDKDFFKKFSLCRENLESFLIANKSVISSMLVYTGSNARTERVASMLEYLVGTFHNNETPTLEGLAEEFKVRGRIIDIRAKVESVEFSDEAKSEMFISQYLPTAPKCPICRGYIEPALSCSYDHLVRREDGGSGEPGNGQISHPYCNHGLKG
ncbi:DUF262 domain-containing protein [Asticcacaulis sp. AND118]|uniref:HNH endonuclease family protein n=1 Tax=Asticcacaulis sp. AND118 TaxID=2840468 RepID=UPI001CFF7BDB|nr:DUF262 domain-containing protein [Asticcacaulis sp. AND118]UDF03285.1 HNH endonuclease [Asticcacaulis sp. AND118]